MFSRWTFWSDRNELPGIDCPGVYAVALSRTSLAGKPFRWTPNIVYIGMTCAKGGLKSRLGQFEATIAGRRTLHGGADRVRFKHRVYGTFAARAYVAIWTVKCSPSVVTPQSLRALGRVAELEYTCWAQFFEKFGTLPEFNDRARSPKYSKRKSGRSK